MVTEQQPFEVVQECRGATVAVGGVLGEEFYDQGVHLLGDFGVHIPRLGYRLRNVLHADRHRVISGVRQLACEHLVEDHA